MPGEISSMGVKIWYAPESSVGVRPTTLSSYKEKATGATLNIAEYVTGISGLTAEYDTYDVTALAETERHRFIKGLQGNSGNISLTCNINPTSRSDWNAIVDEFAALTGGKSMWWMFAFPGDTQAVFFRGEPCTMNFPDLSVNQAVTGTVQIIENGAAGWANIPTT